MRFGWSLFLVSLSAVSTTCSSEAKRNYDVQAAPEFLFQRKPTEFGCLDESRVKRNRVVVVARPCSWPPINRPTS